MAPTPAPDGRASDPRATDAPATGRGPMAHRAPGSAARPAATRSSSATAGAARSSAAAGAGRSSAQGAATEGRPASSFLVGALAAEVGDLLAIGRRMVPNRRAALLVGLALLALLALGGMAGAAEPKPVDRSALDAFGGSAAPAATVAAQRDAGALTSASAAPAGVLPAASSATVATAPTALADDPALQGPNLFDLGTKTALVLALLFVTLRVLRRVQGVGPARGSGLLSVLESRTLGPKTQLHLIAVGDRRLVIGQSPAGLVALGELDAAELPVAEPVRDPWARRDARDEDPDLEAQAVHELANGRRSRLGISA
jgi:flagellar biogenesis protein FliO